MPPYDDVVLRLAKRVQLLRKNLGMTQAALASRAGVTVETVARLERVGRGRPSASTNPSLETLSRLAVALEVDLQDLVAAQPPAQRTNHPLSHLLEGTSPTFTQRILCVAEALLRAEQAEHRQSAVHRLPHAIGTAREVDEMERAVGERGTSARSGIRRT